MINLIGEDILNYRNKKFNENEFFFDYQKKEVKPKRKMGHVTALGSCIAEAENVAIKAATSISFGKQE